MVTSPTDYLQDHLPGVQLNVNNPNFLIMQGRITNVRVYPYPSSATSSFTLRYLTCARILSMVGEAAGARMFGGRKDKAT